jgi:N-acetylmuramoyl-L-alanine amidase
MNIIERPSPNHDARERGIDMLVLHYTGMKTAEDALARLCDPAAKVSAHYTIDRDGTVYVHVDEARRAWHAGVSYWAGARDVNARSVGIELVNPGHEFGYEPFAAEQIEVLIDLAGEIMQRHCILPARVVGHSDVAPARKTDPGELFPWAQLADYGIGLWPGHSTKALRLPIETALGEIGYGVPPHVDWPLDAAIAAFQRRFLPHAITGRADPETARRIEAVHAAIHAPAV